MSSFSNWLIILIYFNYNKNGSRILNSVNISIPGQKMTALVGHSGAGKSTVLNLIPRFYDADFGDIKIDNQSIYNSTIFSLRKKMDSNVMITGAIKKTAEASA